MNGDHPKVLVVDDEKDVRDLAEYFLSNAGYKMILAEDGQQAFKLYSENKDTIDVIVSDVQMPLMNGMELYKKVREIDHVPFVFITGSGEVDLLTKDYLVLCKPLNFDKLPEILNSVIVNHDVNLYK